MMLWMTSSGYRYQDALVRYQAGSPEKRKKNTSYICVIYLVYSIYLICILYMLYIAYIYKVKSVCYINRTSSTSYIG